MLSRLFCLPPAALLRIVCLGLAIGGCGEGLISGGQRHDASLPDDSRPGLDVGPWPDRGVAAADSAPDARRPTPDQGLPPDLGPDVFAGKPVVWIVGDSLAVGAGGPAQTLMGSKYDLTVRGVVGAPISYAKSEVENAMAAGADAIVVQSGINNVGGGTANVSALTKEIGATLDAASGTLCVYWVTYQSVYTQGYLALNSSAPTLNQVIRDEVAKRAPWAGLIDFQPHIDAHPELNAGDGLHLNSDGYQALATFYRDALLPCFGF